MHKSIFQPLQKHPAIPVSAVHVRYSIKLFNTQIYMNVIVNPVLYSVVYSSFDKHLSRMTIY